MPILEPRPLRGSRMGGAIPHRQAGDFAWTGARFEPRGRRKDQGLRH